MGGPPAYLAAETAPQPPATIVKVPTASAAHLAANEYFGLSSAIVAPRRWRRRGRNLAFTALTRSRGCRLQPVAGRWMQAF